MTTDENDSDEDDLRLPDYVTITAELRPDEPSRQN